MWLCRLRLVLADRSTAVIADLLLLPLLVRLVLQLLFLVARLDLPLPTLVERVGLYSLLPLLVRLVLLLVLLVVRLDLLLLPLVERVGLYWRMPFARGWGLSALGVLRMRRLLRVLQRRVRLRQLQV
jgi:hypothetical protein